jgi:hypothetical protein
LNLLQSGLVCSSEASRRAWASKSTGLKIRLVEAGYLAKSAFGRMGRATKLPLQLGQTSAKRSWAQARQKVHSKVQINASGLSGGKSRSQFSQFGRSSNKFFTLFHQPLFFLTQCFVKKRCLMRITVRSVRLKASAIWRYFQF